MTRKGMKTIDELRNDQGVSWEQFMRERVRDLILSNPRLSPVERFDSLTWAGWRLNLITGKYYWPQ
jgi:hypothetical protein